jgi:hypothetical protein
MIDINNIKDISFLKDYLDQLTIFVKIYEKNTLFICN